LVQIRPQLIIHELLQVAKEGENVLLHCKVLLVEAIDENAHEVRLCYMVRAFTLYGRKEGAEQFYHFHEGIVVLLVISFFKVYYVLLYYSYASFKNDFLVWFEFGTHS